MPDAAPDWHAAVRARVAAARLHPQDEAEIVDEIGQHLEDQYAELAPRIGADAARERLLTQLNAGELDDALARRRRNARPSRTRTWSSASLWRDVRYGTRSLRHSPGLVLAGSAALALGIGLTTLMFSVIYGTLMKGLPFRDAERIALIYYADPAREDDQIPLGDFVRYAAQQRSFEAIGAYSLGSANVSGGDRPERVGAVRVTAGMIEVTGTKPILGRTFAPNDNDPAAPPTAILAYALWRDQFRADSGVIGRQVRVNGRPYTIVGVMPERFEFPNQSTRVWLPIQSNTAVLNVGEGPGLTVIARLRPTVTYDAADAEAATISQRLARERPPNAADRRAVVQPFVRGFVPARVYSLFYAMLGAVMLVLLVACANVANLLLDRALGRSREIGIRTALGATRLAVVRQALVESGLIALLAAVVGSALAQGGIIVFNRAMLESQRYFWMDIRLHPPVLAFVLAMAVVASLVSGLLPAMQSAGLDVGAILKDEAHTASSLRVGRLSRSIVAIQIAVTCALLIAAGFATRSIMNLRQLEPRFASRDVFTARVSLTTADTLRRREVFEALDGQLRALPGVQGAYVGSGLPGTGWGGSRLAIEGKTYPRERDRPFARTLSVTPGFFTTFGVRVVSGRAITAADRRGAAPVAVVSESFVRRFFAGVTPLGRRIRVAAASGDSTWLTVVGVVPTLYAANFNLQNLWPAEVLTAFWQNPDPTTVSVAIRGAPDVANAASIRKIVTALDPETPIYATQSMEDVLAEPMWGLQVFGSMFAVFGVISLALAAIGLYAVMAFSVSRRVRELGIRMALGATGADVIRLVGRQGARQILVGLAIGFIVGAAVVRAARATLFEVTPNDPTVFAVVAGVLAAAALAACLVPAARAARVDPVVALRSD